MSWGLWLPNAGPAAKPDVSRGCCASKVNIPSQSYLEVDLDVCLINFGPVQDLPVEVLLLEAHLQVASSTANRGD
jgi:hypothetical protein